MTDTRTGASAAPRVEAEDRIELISAGVDIGSATSHLVLSRLEMRKVGSRYVVTGRLTLHESPVMLTPYRAGERIDGEQLGQFVDAQYRAAGVRREDVDTGALILTGVALLRENARAIADTFALEAGRMVAVSAGDNLESIMAAHGSGAVSLSRSAGRILNVDIGGGTTKLAVCEQGRVTAVAAVDVGARGVVFDASGTVTRMEMPGRLAAAAVGALLQEGQLADAAVLDAITDLMADAVVTASPLRGYPAALSPLARSGDLAGTSPVDAVVFSGGVSEYIYRREPAEFGDLGPALAGKLRGRYEDRGADILAARSGIRATVVGASQYTAQVSGSTIHLSDPEILPLRNVPVVDPMLALGDSIDPAAVADKVCESLRTRELGDAAGPLAVAVHWDGPATVGRLASLAEGLACGLRLAGQDSCPLVVVCDDDVGRLLGRYLEEAAAGRHPVTSLDGVVLSELDYIDIGARIPGASVVPIVVKSLVFPDLVPAR